MTASETEAPPALPDFLLDPNAVLKDKADWRYGRAPDYSNTRKIFEETKTQNHEAGSLPFLVENLVKNWEIEASFKTSIDDWRTVDRSNYTFAINGGPPQPAEHMLKVGTYNAIIAANQYYCPASSDFASSHKTFKRMMPTFAWEVLEVYSGPPVVSFKWRHWGTMKNDYVGLNSKGERVTIRAHGESIDIQGISVAKVDDKLQIQSIETWFDPMEMFRQIVAGRSEDEIERVLVVKGEEGARMKEIILVPATSEEITEGISDQARTNDAEAPLVVRPAEDKTEASALKDASFRGSDRGANGKITVEESVSVSAPSGCPFLSDQAQGS